MGQNNNKLKLSVEGRLSKLEVKVNYIKGDVKHIKEQVSNDIPHKIEEITNSLQGFLKEQNKRVFRIYIAVIFLLVAVIVNLIIQFTS